MIKKLINKFYNKKSFNTQYLLNTKEGIRGDIVFKAVVGSHAHGTNIEGSDTDIKGIYIQSPESVLEHGYQEQVTITDDEVYYELKRVAELCCTGNPTMLELLYSPLDCILYKDPIIDGLLEKRDDFLSKSCKYSFGGYAIAQIQKASGLDKKMNWEKDKTERKTILDFCYILTPAGSTPLKHWLGIQRGNECDEKNYGVAKVNNAKDVYYIYYNDKDLGYKGLVSNEETSQDLNLSSIPYSEVLKYKVLVYNKDGYSAHCKDYKEYSDWLKNRNTQRYVDIERHNQKIDGKNMLHCIRLITMGKEIAEGKGLIVRRPEAKYLISIRKGEVNLQELLLQAENLKKEMDSLFLKSTLQDKVDRGYFLKLVTTIRKEYYKK